MLADCIKGYHLMFISVILIIIQLKAFESSMHKSLMSMLIVLTIYKHNTVYKGLIYSNRTLSISFVQVCRTIIIKDRHILIEQSPH